MKPHMDSTSKDMPAPRNRGGRPRTEPPRNLLTKVAKAAMYATNRRSIAHKLRIGVTVFERWRRDDPQIDEVIDYVWANRADPIVKGIIQDAVAGDPKAREAFFKRVDPFGQAQDARQGSTTINVTGEHAQVAVIPAPPLPSIDAFLIEHGLIRDPNLIEQDKEPDE